MSVVFTPMPITPAVLTEQQLDEWAAFLQFVDGSTHMIEFSPPATTSIVETGDFILNEFGNRTEKFHPNRFTGRSRVILDGYVGSTQPDVAKHGYWSAFSQAATAEYKASHPDFPWDPNQYNYFVTSGENKTSYTRATIPAADDTSMMSIKANLNYHLFFLKRVSRRTDFDYSILPMVPIADRHKLDMHALSSNPHLDFGFVDAHIDSFAWNFSILSQHPNLTWEFVYKHATRPWSKVLLRNHPFLNQWGGV